MQPDYDDIRFKHEDTPTNFLDYWIESYDSTEASVWVKIPNLPAGSSKMYLFYGNPDANSESDFGEVFDDWVEKWPNDEMLSECDPNWEGVWDPDICYGDNQYLVAWEEGEAYYGFPYNKGFKQEIRASMFSTDGTETVHDKLIFSDKNKYFIVMPIVLGMFYVVKNLMRSKIGRAFVAIRDNDLAAEVMGINVFLYKVLAFAICSFCAGVAGCLWAMTQGMVHPDQFSLMDSIWY